MKKKITKEFIDDSKKIHGDRYDYSLVDYKNSYTNIKIICSIHGEFPQTPQGHLSGQGCKKCYGRLVSDTNSFIEQSNIIHNNKYDYLSVNYINSNLEVKIICKKHGEFNQKPYIHLQGKGCSDCNESRGENKIKSILLNNNILFENQKTFDGCKFKNKLRFDFYLPKYNICIEYDGEQHFNEISYYGGKNKLYKTKIYDKIKTEYCKNNNIKLLRIKYNENIEDKLSFIFSL